MVQFLKMKKLLLIMLIFIVGFLIGSVFSISGIFAPSHQVRFTADYVINSGTIARQRQSTNILSDGIYPIELPVMQANPRPQLEIMK